MLRWFFLAAALFAFCGCNSYKVKKMIKGGSLVSDNFSVTLPFDSLFGGHIVIEARINGAAEPARFLFDAGASDCWISEAYAKEIGFDPKGRVEIYAGNGKWKETGIGVFTTCEIHGVVFKDIVAGVEPGYDNSVWECGELKGVLGGALIRHAKWKIDYQNKTLTLTDDLANFEALTGREPLRFMQHPLDFRPFLKGKIGSAEIEPFMLDTGFDGAVALDKRSATALDSADLASPTAFEIDRLAQKAHGATRDTVTAMLLDVRLETAVFPKETVRFVKDLAPALVGNRLLEGRTVYLDYETSSCWLLPNSYQPQSPDASTFGFLPAYADEDYWLTGRLLSGGAAANAGLSFNDTIWSINGMKPSACFEDYCGYEAWVVYYLDARESVEIEFGPDRKKATIRQTPFFEAK